MDMKSQSSQERGGGGGGEVPEEDEDLGEGISGVSLSGGMPNEKTSCTRARADQDPQK